MAALRYSDCTPQLIFLNRRQVLLAMAGALSARAASNWMGPARKSPFSTTEPQNTFDQVAKYNNYYEFGTRKTEPVEYAKDFRTDPWQLSIEGVVKKPRKLSLDDIRKAAPLEERIYKFRCVEGWSAVIPWVGYSLNALLKTVQPTSEARFVQFETFFDAGQMPHAGSARLDFPYVEGLRLDEAQHPLTLLAVGMYGQPLPPQNGAPVRVIVPWKYGFKSGKSLVRFRLTKEQPRTSWNIKKPTEYGFYSNVNPDVAHPRWSQAAERKLGDILKHPTLPFNGYADQVAHLYKGMDLVANF
jgi:sulfoxide reductase catalytic subunit YedY